MKKAFLIIPFCAGFPFMFIALLMIIQHWPHSALFHNIGLSLEGVFFALAIYEVVSSTKAEQSMKITWLILLLLAPLMWFFVFNGGLILMFLILTMGILYLAIGRKAFVPAKGKIEFDSV